VYLWASCYFPCPTNGAFIDTIRFDSVLSHVKDTFFFFGGLSFGERKTAVIFVRFYIAKENNKFNFKNVLVLLGFFLLLLLLISLINLSSHALIFPME